VEVAVRGPARADPRRADARHRRRREIRDLHHHRPPRRRGQGDRRHLVRNAGTARHLGPHLCHERGAHRRRDGNRRRRPGKDHARHRAGRRKGSMTVETSPTPQSGIADDVQQRPRVAVSALVTNLREYGLVLALIIIMLFFQFTTDGTLFKPLNLSNLVQQNSFIIVMALGMLLVIVAGHIDLSVGSVAGFIGALGANMMVTWQLGLLSNPLVASIVCLLVGAAIGAAQGYWIAYHRIPSFIVTLGGMLIFRGLCQAMLGGGLSVGPLPNAFKELSSGFIPEVLGVWTLV